MMMKALNYLKMIHAKRKTKSLSSYTHMAEFIFIFTCFF